MSFAPRAGLTTYDTDASPPDHFLTTASTARCRSSRTAISRRGPAAVVRSERVGAGPADAEGGESRRAVVRSARLPDLEPLCSRAQPDRGRVCPEGGRLHHRL